MYEFFFSLGYLGLFLITALAASLIPLASEFFIVAMPPLGYNVYLVGLVATLGGFSGSALNYYIGLKGTDFILGRYIKIDEKTWQRAENFYQRWGQVVLFFSWLPFIGDPLTVVAGALHLNWRNFIFWVMLGKSIRNIILLGLADRIISLF